MVLMRRSGVFNETEAWPLMFKSANSTGALPILDEVCPLLPFPSYTFEGGGSAKTSQKLSWLPVDQAGQAISEIVLSTITSPTLASPHAEVYHVLNARCGAWSDVLKGLKEGGLVFETVERREWLRRLAGSEPDVSKNPTIKLLVSPLL